MSTVILGAGFGGLAAAWSTLRSTHDFVIVSAGLGASAMYSGLIDVEPWEGGSHQITSSNCDLLQAFGESFSQWMFSRESFIAATQAGILRAANGADRSILDLNSLQPGTIVIPRFFRQNWHADALANALNASTISRQHSFNFIAVDCDLSKHVDESTLSDADFAMRLEDPKRLQWVSDQMQDAIRAAGPKVTAILTGPWLGIRVPVAQELSHRLGIRVGEVASSLSTTAGLRFEHARDSWFQANRISHISGWIERLEKTVNGFHVHIQGHSKPLHAHHVIVATGGLASGAIQYHPNNSSNVPFQLHFEAPLHLGFGPMPLERASSLFGPDTDAFHWPTSSQPNALERIGIVSDRNTTPHLFVAGDAMAGQSRTVGKAILSGIHAGEQSATLKQ